jgi:uncharacterized membrane protein
VFYTISTETAFSLDLRRFIAYLGRRRQPEIEAAKSRLIRGAASSLALQSAFQGAFALSLVLVSPLLARSLGFPPEVFIRLLAAGFLQLIFLSSLNMLFYMELYRRAAASALAFALVTLGLSLAACLTGHALPTRGLPYLIGAASAAALATVFAFRGLQSFDRVVFLRATGDDFGR